MQQPTFLRQALIGAACALLLAPALAQGSDAERHLASQAFSIVAPFPPGGPVDTLSRILATGLTARYRQPAVVDNRTGASGNIGIELVKRAALDRGQTLSAFVEEALVAELGRNGEALSRASRTGASLRLISTRAPGRSSSCRRPSHHMIPLPSASGITSTASRERGPTTTGRANRAWAAFGTISIASTSGQITGPPSENA